MSTEKDFLNTIFPLLKQEKNVVVGPGDDCAVLEVGDSENFFLMAVDQLISTVHFDPTDTTPEEAGAKLINRNISDIASMGGKPLHALVTLAVGNQDTDWIKKFYKGLSREANKWNVSICGGDVALLGKNENFVSTLSITGKVKKDNICLRKNASVGDFLYATGTFGDSFATRHHLNFLPRVKEGVFLASGYTSAMMDVSDGLLLDLQRMAEASNVTIKLFLSTIPSRRTKLPLKNIISDGEDYELIFTVKPALEEKLLEEWPFNDVRLTKIGEIISSQNNFVIDENNLDLIERYSNIGFDHFVKENG